MEAQQSSHEVIIQDLISKPCPPKEVRSRTQGYRTTRERASYANRMQHIASSLHWTNDGPILPSDDFDQVTDAASELQRREPHFALDLAPWEKKRREAPLMEPQSCQLPPRVTMGTAYDGLARPHDRNNLHHPHDRNNLHISQTHMIVPGHVMDHLENIEIDVSPSPPPVGGNLSRRVSLRLPVAKAIDYPDTLIPSPRTTPRELRLARTTFRMAMGRIRRL